MVVNDHYSNICGLQPAISIGHSLILVRSANNQGKLAIQVPINTKSAALSVIMVPMKILIPNTIPIDVAQVPGVTPVVYSPYTDLPSEHFDAEALVVWGGGNRFLSHLAQNLTQLKWIGALSAGIDNIERAGFAPGITVTNASGLHDRPVTEHTMALILAATRRLDLMHNAQLEGRWAKELGGSQPVGIQNPGAGTFPGLASLHGARISIWGFGSIGQTLAPLLTIFGAQVTGVARSAGTRAGIPVITQEQALADLANTDMIVNILPGSPETKHIINADVLAALPKHAWVINVGRGISIDEAALNEALINGEIGGAALDVFDREPLPTDSPLWTAPNIIITPHAAGGRPEGVSELLNTNIAAFLAGTELTNVVKVL